MTRYDNLYQTMDRLGNAGIKHLKFLEIGTFDGVRTSQLLRYWLNSNNARTVRYYGFDLWELLTREESKKELSKSRLPPTRDQVESRLQAVGKAVTVKLFQGNTRETLPAALPDLPLMDLIFQDGGHSLETVASDWKYAKQLMYQKAVYLLDDYYENRKDYGCQQLVQELMLDRLYRVKLLDPVDEIEQSGLKIRFAEVTQQLIQ